ncbi:MAG TPA: hypothetical protein EYN07_05010 [Flavobacteriaceae bacterium]|jgi:predicted RNA methylase|nr:hypothetical protein [Flavobacteriaceae bacterium]HBR55605.1 hypothetical protein [Flavobacteriaceae bacterium]HIB46718.1 hypothetical protein [Flavobacteriaceae bacterium]HIN98582.1 hypothetical protein [Flavobacteriaceae bacterium]|tara:strand:- start:130882 stop:131907 length:1026 start_codon:yes stop_codon:yes gene_type:complete
MNTKTLDYFKRLEGIATILFSKEIEDCELQEAIKSYDLLLRELSPLNFDSPEQQQNLELKSGVAIASKWAASCAQDTYRTKRFCQGIYNAVTDLLIKRNKPVEILYAGTGPFATLALPLLTKFSSEEIQLTLLEVNPASHQSAFKIIEKLGLQRFIKEAIQCDATKINLVHPETIDIIVVECLQHALAREPQVEITENLVKQTSKDVILIPEQIDLAIAVCSNQKLGESKSTDDNDISNFEFTERVFSLNKDLFLNKQSFQNPRISFTPKTVLLPKAFNNTQITLAITTTIKIYKEEIVSRSESGLTAPLYVGVFDGKKEFNQLIATYITGTSPHLEVLVN